MAFLWFHYGSQTVFWPEWSYLLIVYHLYFSSNLSVSPLCCPVFSVNTSVQLIQFIIVSSLYDYLLHNTKPMCSVLWDSLILCRTQGKISSTWALNPACQAAHFHLKNESVLSSGSLKLLSCWNASNLKSRFCWDQFIRGSPHFLRSQV